MLYVINLYYHYLCQRKKEKKNLMNVGKSVHKRQKCHPVPKKPLTQIIIGLGLAPTET